jgi:hypothetical protein
VRVAEAVRVDALLDSCLRAQPRQQSPHIFLTDGIALQGAENRDGATEPELPALLKPALEQRDDAGVEPDRAGACGVHKLGFACKFVSFATAIEFMHPTPCRAEATRCCGRLYGRKTSQERDRFS